MQWDMIPDAVGKFRTMSARMNDVAMRARPRFRASGGTNSPPRYTNRPDFM